MNSWKILYKNKFEEIKSSQLLKILLKNRNIVSQKETNEFLRPNLEKVTPKNAGINLRELDKGIERIKRAIKNNEKIIIFGDYDVDGITGSAILWENLRKLTDNVMPYIPDRIEEGYGLSNAGIENLLKKYKDTKLIITVDNGIVAGETIKFAKQKNLDVIVTDHHVPGKEKIQTVATIHTTSVCGCTVSYLFTKVILKKLHKTDIEKSYLELVALATVADLVPLNSFNRTLLKFGLEELRKTKRPGLQELFKEAQIDPSSIDTYQIGHIIAPRLNATGRIADAMDSLRLLCTNNPKRAYEIAAHLGQTNRDRQKMTMDSLEHAKSNLKLEKKKLLFISHESYEPGIVGLIAGRLVEEFYVPSIVLSVKGKYARASARSVAGFNIIEFIREAGEFLTDAGGHPMAAGFTVETKKILKLQKMLEDLAEKKLKGNNLERVLTVDCLLPLKLINEKIFQEVSTLEPFGMGNPKPVFLAQKVMIEGLRMVGQEQKHMKLVLSEEKIRFDAIFFRAGDASFRIGDTVDIVYTIEENKWNGNIKLELRIKAIRTSSIR